MLIVIVIDDQPKEPVKPNAISDAITSHIQMTQTNKKIPNIAQELAMNRNNSRTLSPSAPTIPTTPVIGKVTESVVVTDKKEQAKPKPKPKPKSKPKPMVETKIPSASNASVLSDEKAQLKQVRIASLLSTGEEPKTTSLEKSIDMTKQMPSSLRFKQDSPTPSNISKLLSPSTKTIPIVPIVKTTTQKKTADSKPVEKKVTKQTTVTVVPKKKSSTLSNKPALKRTKSNSVTTGSNPASSSTSKKNSTAGTTKASKSKSATSLDSMKKKAAAKKSQDNDKKKNSDNATKATSTSTATAAKLPTVPEPSKLIQAPLIGDAKLLSKTNSVSEKSEPISIVDIPLYSSASNEYLDENGTVTFNLFRILKQNEPKLDSKEEKDLKRKRLFNQDMDSKDNMTDVDDIIDDDEDMEDNTETDKTETQPKKKAHPMKGKNLIGKYDFEDPFIDDSEMLWEEQRASTKDGFFVFFGPLIAKGQSASFERADGTMKRGGIKK